MKADKILFGAACLGMAYMIHTTANHSCCKDERYSAVLPETVKKAAINHELAKDTISFSKAVKTLPKAIK